MVLIGFSSEQTAAGSARWAKKVALSENQLEKCNYKTDNNLSIDSFSLLLPSVLNDVNWLVHWNLHKKLLKPFLLPALSHCGSNYAILPFHLATLHIFHARMTECWWGVSGQFQKSVRTALFSWKPADSWSVQRVGLGLWSPVWLKSRAVEDQLPFESVWLSPTLIKK